MGIVPSLLTELAPMCVEVLILPLVLSLWLYSKTGLGGGVAATSVLLYHFLRVGYNFKNPLPVYTTSQEISDANAVYFRHFPLFIVASATVGTLVGYLLDLRGMLPYYRLSEGTAGERLEVATGGDSVKDYITKFQNTYESDGYVQWGYKRIAMPVMHLFFTTIIFLWTVPLSFMLFGFLFPVSKYAAFGSAGLVALLGYIVLAIYSLKKTELGVYGPSKENLRQRTKGFYAYSRKEDDDALIVDPDFGPNDSNGQNKYRDAVFERTKYTIYKNVLVIGLIHLIGFILEAGVVTFLTDPSINVPWIVGLCYILLVALVVLIAFIITWWNRSDREDDLFLRKSSRRNNNSSSYQPPVANDTTDEENETDTETDNESTAMTTTNTTSSHKVMNKMMSINGLLDKNQ
jgi:hypothetical protein